MVGGNASGVSCRTYLHRFNMFEHSFLESLCHSLLQKEGMGRIGRERGGERGGGEGRKISHPRSLNRLMGPKSALERGGEGRVRVNLIGCEGGDLDMAEIV